MPGTRKVPVPISMPKGRVGKGHLLPDLRVGNAAPTGFVRVPGGSVARYGMVAYAGTAITPEDMLVRWEKEMGIVPDRKVALATLRQFVAALGRFKIGNVIEIEYAPTGNPELRKVWESPPTEHSSPLPE